MRESHSMFFDTGGSFLGFPVDWRKVSFLLSESSLSGYVIRKSLLLLLFLGNFNLRLIYCRFASQFLVCDTSAACSICDVNTLQHFLSCASSGNFGLNKSIFLTGSAFLALLQWCVTWVCLGVGVLVSDSSVCERTLCSKFFTGFFRNKECKHL